ncbi:MAG: hypothetical protein CMH52_04530 [Myxococcales bacterium]|nr:hypothetical protein [Myxococcales bacterium]
MTWLTRPNLDPRDLVDTPSQELDDTEHTLHMTDSNHGRKSTGKKPSGGRVSAPKNVGTRPLIESPSSQLQSGSKSGHLTKADPVLSKPVPPVPKLSSPTHVEPARMPRQKVTSSPSSQTAVAPRALTSTQLGLLIVAAAVIGGVAAWFIAG